MLNVSDFLKIADNVYGSVAEDSIVGDVKTWMDSGSYVFNALVSGNIYRGVPANKILGLIGSESTGKTFFALAAAKAFQEKDHNSIILYFDSEGALTRDQLVGRKLDLKRFVSLPVATVQDFKNQAIRIVDKYLEEKNSPPILIILDSLGNLSTTKEMEDSAAGSETKDMTRSQILKAAFRVLSLKLGAANIPFILTNHVYDQIGAGPYAGKEQSGGSRKQVCQQYYC